MNLPFIDDLTEAFEYLDNLRESGATNMFGAGSWLRDDLGMDRSTASAVLSAWMGSFGPAPAAERAAQAIDGESSK